MKKRLFAILVCVSMLLCFASCQSKDGKLDDVIVLFSNDIHCAIDESIGYAGISAYKKDMEEKYRYVVLADCGDFVQGTYEGAVSQGESIIDIMNAVGYDFAIFGNHEFDYGMEQLKKNVQRSSAQFLNSNVTYTGNGEDWLSECTKPYEIRTYGKIKVAFIGVSTPLSIISSTPLNFMEDGKYVYDLCAGNNGHDLYDTVQKNIDECLEKGADHIIVLSHLGLDTEADSPFTSLELIENTTGIDVVLDAHSHDKVSCRVHQDKDGEDVLISSTGTQLQNIGKLVLTPDGTVSIGYIDSYGKKDEDIVDFIADTRSDFEEQMNAVVAHIDTSLLCTDSDGIRMVRNREIPLGNFVADAYRIIGCADIGMCNGGGIRADLNSGDIKYKDVISLAPFGNTLCVVKVTGSEILDMLEYFYRFVQADYKKDGDVCGEYGSFQQVSGLKFTIDTSIEPSVEADENDTFIGVTGARRVSDVSVLQKDGSYAPIDPDAAYTLASHNYTIKNGGSGMLDFLADHELVINESVSDYQLLIDYINMLDGDMSDYIEADNRINIK